MKVRYIKWRWDKHQTSADEVYMYPDGFDYEKCMNTEENIVDLWSGIMWTGDYREDGKFYLKYCGFVDASRLDNP